MFNLDDAIATWREQLAASGIKSTAILTELESHLRDDIARQMISGSSAQPAFEAAVQRIGGVAALKSEFAKVEGTSREKWKSMGTFPVALAISYSLAGTFALVKIAMNWNERMAGFGALMMAALSIFSWRFQFSHGIRNRRIQRIIQSTYNLTALLWLPFFFYLILPRFDLTLGSLVVAILWAIIPALALAGISSGSVNVPAKKMA
jgi:hypothetical protein